MPTPFPGMDPYLEKRGMWEQVHTALIVALQQHLSPLVRPRYRVDIEQRVYLEIEPRHADLVGMPDARITATGRAGAALAPAPTASGPSLLFADLPMPATVIERYLEIREVATGDVITVIELLSPTNKRSGAGYQEYQAKRLQTLGSRTHLVEIDLIRSEAPLPMRLHDGSPGDYRIVVSRAPHRPRAEVYAFNLRDPIPDFPVPLLAEDPDPVVPLNQLLHDLYDRAGYDLAMDYSPPPDPPLSLDDATWAAALSAKAIRPA